MAKVGVYDWLQKDTWISGDEGNVLYNVYGCSRHLYIHLQNSLHSTMKTGECYSVKKYSSKKIFKVTHNKSACFSKNHPSKNILLSKQIFICRKSGNNT